MKPYSDQNNIREFSSNVDELDLVWHQDKEDRLVEVLEGKGWKFQRDNKIPVDMKVGDCIFIPEGEIHRTIKGTTDLKIKING
tara:strand:- start:1314 stop:1562 length:249 start_codon:yes stop_codon:yes gene_type:complete